MIKTETVKGRTSAGVIFKEHELAHKYLDNLKGIEIGAAAHNPFGLSGCKAVGLGMDKDAEDYEFFKHAQLEMCGAFVVPDISAEAHDLPLDDNSQDYVLTSHVIEHLPNPIGAFKEWNRVVKSNGFIFSIVPLRNALPADQFRPVTELSQIITAYVDNWTVDTVPFRHQSAVPGGRRGHYFIWTPELFVSLIDYCVKENILNWKVVEIEEIDTKVGNGFTVVAQKAEIVTAEKS